MDVELQLKSLMDNYNDMNKKLDGFILAYQSMLLRLNQIEKALQIKKETPFDPHQPTNFGLGNL